MSAHLDIYMKESCRWLVLPYYKGMKNGKEISPLSH